MSTLHYTTTWAWLAYVREVHYNMLKALEGGVEYHRRRTTFYICKWVAVRAGVDDGGEALTSQPQKRSTQFLGGGSSYVSASISFRPLTKSMSSGLTIGVRKYNFAPM